MYSPAQQERQLWTVSHHVRASECIDVEDAFLQPQDLDLDTRVPRASKAEPLPCFSPAAPRSGHKSKPRLLSASTSIPPLPVRRRNPSLRLRRWRRPPRRHGCRRLEKARTHSRRNSGRASRTRAERPLALAVHTGGWCGSLETRGTGPRRLCVAFELHPRRSRDDSRPGRTRRVQRIPKARAGRTQLTMLTFCRLPGRRLFC
ncbi:hypothetical protein C8T65DRAFT_665214 [Cerioporus squamosus]|nr:hypothetical protein C8T65DRAFT_665214 [Cerioporus squamosus]